MAAEPILIVDDTPVNLKLTRILLANEGYRVRTASSAEEALELLRCYLPALVLADIQLPGMDGLEMTRRIKSDPRTRGITVVALTASAMKGDEQKALDAGCDGYITKPIDTRTLGERIRHYLAAHGHSRAADSAPPGREVETVSDAEMQDLRRRFLVEGQERTRQFLLDLEGAFDPDGVSHTVHQWVGSGGLLGYPAISRAAREVEKLLLERPLDTGQLRDSLTLLALALASPVEAQAPIPDALLRALSGKIVALAGLPASEAERLCVALESAEARPVFFELDAPPDRAALAACDAVVVYIGPSSGNSPWLHPSSPAAVKPTIFLGSRDRLLSLDPRMQARAPDLLMDSWEPEEALVRLSIVLSRPPAAVPRASRPPDGRPIRVLVSSADPIAVTLVRTAAENSNMECIEAPNAASALDLLRSRTPDVAVLDIGIPLEAIRREAASVPILLLTARNHVPELLHAIALGACDYVVKPFSPLELIARIQRLVSH